MTQIRTKVRQAGGQVIDGVLPRRPFTTDEYERMIANGIIREGERVELVEGAIVQMAAMGSSHMAGVTRATYCFLPRLGTRAIVRVQGPIRIPPRAEPEPDVAVVRPRADFYVDRHPEPDDVLLVIEVSDSSLAHDRRVKVPMYARAGIAEVWLADLMAGTVTVFRDPRGSRYQQVTVYHRGDTISPLAFSDLAIGVTDIIGE